MTESKNSSTAKMSKKEQMRYIAERYPVIQYMLGYFEESLEESLDESLARLLKCLPLDPERTAHFQQEMCDALAEPGLDLGLMINMAAGDTVEYMGEAIDFLLWVYAASFPDNPQPVVSEV